MSVHFIRHWPEGNWVFDYNFPEKSKDEIYRDYLSTVKRGLETGLFDVLGHVDMVKDTGDSLINIVPTEVDSLLETLKKMDMCIEINSSGFRKKVGEPYPGFDWLALIKEKSVPLTIGSDAHHPNQVGLEFDSVYQHLTKEGVKEIITFDNRRKIKMVIG
jgi:histidinol-phosphatase (PHP family)